MAICPICAIRGIFSESIAAGNEDERGLDAVVFFDCPRCGTFKIDAVAVGYVVRLESPQARELASWIRDRNLDDMIPLICGSLVNQLYYVHSS